MFFQLVCNLIKIWIVLITYINHQAKLVFKSHIINTSQNNTNKKTPKMGVFQVG
jgi:hypothetical protein